MKDILVPAILIAVGIVGLGQAGNLGNLYSASPESPENRQALDSCAAEPSAFDRVDAVGRDGCTARMRVPPPTVQVIGPPRVPKDDIRRIQAVQH